MQTRHVVAAAAALIFAVFVYWAAAPERPVTLEPTPSKVENTAHRVRTEHVGPSTDLQSKAKITVQSASGPNEPAALPIEVVATRRMYVAHEALRRPEVADPDSDQNRIILEAMVKKALSHSRSQPRSDLAQP